MNNGFESNMGITTAGVRINVPENRVGTIVRITHLDWGNNFNWKTPILNINLDNHLVNIQNGTEGYSSLDKDCNFDSQNHSSFYMVGLLDNLTINCKARGLFSFLSFYFNFVVLSFKSKILTNF